MDKDIFFSMVKKWAVHDYCAPGIKAEVILDMLLSEFIEELIEYHYINDINRKIKAKMLTKEFPIRTNDDNLRNAKVDYLVSIDDKQLLLVELKTTKDSFNKGQMGLMQKAIKKGVRGIIEFYCDIIQSKTGNRLDERKYRNAFYKFCEKEELTKDIGNFQKRLINKYENKEADYLYILLVPDGENDKDSRIDEDRQLVLSNYCDGKDGEKDFKEYIEKSKDKVYCERWELVSKILKECIEFADPKRIERMDID